MPMSWMVALLVALVSVLASANAAAAVTKPIGSLRVQPHEQYNQQAKPVAATASKQRIAVSEAHQWTVSPQDVQNCAALYGNGALYLEFWESKPPSTLNSKEHVSAVLTTKPFDPSAFVLEEAPSDSVDRQASAAQLTYQRVWGPAFSRQPARSGWMVTVINRRSTPLPQYYLRLTCAPAPPCPSPLLGRGTCSGRGTCITPSKKAAASGQAPAARGQAPASFCKCSSVWADFGCSVEAPALQRLDAQQSFVPPALQPPAPTGTYNRQLYQVQVKPITQHLIIQLSTPQPVLHPGRPQLCILPASLAANASALLPPSAFTLCTTPLPTGVFPPVQYIYLSRLCNGLSRPPNCHPLLGSSYLVAVQNLDPEEPAPVTVEALWRNDDIPICPRGCSLRGYCAKAMPLQTYKCICNPGWTGDFCQHEVQATAVTRTGVTRGLFDPFSLIPGDAKYWVLPLSEKLGGGSGGQPPFWVRIRHRIPEARQGPFVVKVQRTFGQPSLEALPALFEVESAGESGSRIEFTALTAMTDEELSDQVTSAIRAQIQAAGPSNTVVLMIQNQNTSSVFLQFEFGPAPSPSPIRAAPLRPVAGAEQKEGILGLQYTHFLIILIMAVTTVFGGIMWTWRTRYLRAYNEAERQRRAAAAAAAAAAADTTAGLPQDIISTFPTFAYKTKLQKEHLQQQQQQQQNGPAGDLEAPPVTSPRHQRSRSQLLRSLSDKFASLTSPTPEEDACSETDATACAICLAEYDPDDLLRRLPCGHEFHADCIDGWLQQKTSCPICRLNLMPEDLRNVDGSGGTSEGADMVMEVRVDGDGASSSGGGVVEGSSASSSTTTASGSARDGRRGSAEGGVNGVRRGCGCGGNVGGGRGANARAGGDGASSAGVGSGSTGGQEAMPAAPAAAADGAVAALTESSGAVAAGSTGTAGDVPPAAVTESAATSAEAAAMMTAAEATDSDTAAEAAAAPAVAAAKGAGSTTAEAPADAASIVTDTASFVVPGEGVQGAAGPVPPTGVTGGSGDPAGHAASSTGASGSA